MRHLPVLLLLFERSGANLGIRISWKPNVTVHLPCISILSHPPKPRTRPRHQRARPALTHTQQQPGHLWSPGSAACVRVCMCARSSRQRVRPRDPANTDSYSGRVWPARHWEPRRVLQAAMSGACGGLPGGDHFYSKKLTVHTHTLFFLALSH